MYSGPEIQVSHSPAGRETLATFATETARLAVRDTTPEIQVTHAPAGRDTLATFAAEAARFAVRDTAPEIEIAQTSAGHETLAAIAADVQREAGRIAREQGWDGEPEADSAVRPRMTTLSYEDEPARPARKAESAPEVIIGRARPGQNTLTALEQDAVASALGSGLRITEPPPSSASLEVFEMATFVVRGSDLARLSSVESRRQFVASTLMGRLPVNTMEQVDRIDVTPWTVRNTVIVRVWCRIATA